MNKQALRRFVEAVEAGKRPRASDSRAAAEYLRTAVLGAIFNATPSEGRGRPSTDARAFRDPVVQRQLEAALALARHVGERAPTEKDYDEIAEDRGVSKRSMRRYWNSSAGRMARSLAAAERSQADLCQKFRRFIGTTDSK